MIACTLAAAAAAELVCTTLKGFSSSSGAIYDRCDGEDELPSQCSAVQTKPWANQASPPVRKMSMQLTALKWSIAAIAYYFVCHNWLHMHLCIHAQTLTRCATDGTDNFNNAQIFVWEPPHLCAATYLWSDSLPICYTAITWDESYWFCTIWRKKVKHEIQKNKNFAWFWISFVPAHIVCVYVLHCCTMTFPWV